MPLTLNITVMLTGYLLVMGYLAAGLRLACREARPGVSGGGPGRFSGEKRHDGRRGGRKGRLPVAAASRRGWPAFVRHVLTTAAGGYVLLMAAVVAYYHGVARLGGSFLAEAFTGAARLLVLTLPLFLAASWLSERRSRRR